MRVVSTSSFSMSSMPSASSVALRIAGLEWVTRSSISCCQK